MDTSFVAANIRRIARQKFILSLVCLGGALILTCVSCALIFLRNDSNLLALFIGGTVLGVELSGLSFWFVNQFSRTVRVPLQNAALIGINPFDARETALEQIDQEAIPYAGKSLWFATEHWVISSKLTAFEIMSIDEIVWIYKRPCGLLARLIFGWSYAAVIWSREKRSLALPGTAEEVDQVLHKIEQAIPWVEKGYSKFAHKIWAEPEVGRSLWWHERSKFTEAVDQRRERLLGRKNEGFYPGKSSPLVRLHVYDPAFQRTMGTYKMQSDRRNRGAGAAFVIFGFLWLLVPITRFVHGVADDSQMGYVFLFLWMGIWASIIGVWAVVLGAEAEEYARLSIFKDGLSTTLTIIIFTILSFAFVLGVPAVLKALGYNFMLP